MIKAIIHKFKPKPPRNKYFGTVIDNKNKIIVLNNYGEIYQLSKCLNAYSKTEVQLICGLWYCHEGLKEIIKLYYAVIKNKLAFPNINIHILCNTQTECDILTRLGLQCVYCNHNAFLDENVFTIVPHNQKKFNAVYNAVLSKFKRQFLAAYIDRLALVTYNFGNVSYKKYLDSVLKDALWLNYSDASGKPRFYNNQELVEIYNSSHVGLALSAIEGAMYSSGEYLLCGIPVVSTKSKGGRDVFFTKNNSIICEDSAQDVKRAVDELILLKKDAENIRHEMIEMMKPHRENFVQYVNSLYKKLNVKKDIRDTWDNWYVNKLRNELTKEQIADILFK